MVTANMIQGLFKQEQGISNQVSSFRPGQIVYGQVTKLYPNQMAEVQIGSQKVIAQLEAPLEANERYWFQVQSGEGEINLKVLTSTELNGKGTISPESLLSKLSLPATKENIELVKYMLKEQLPLTKEGIVTASEWLKQTNPMQQGFEALKFMTIKGLPFTKDVYFSLVAMQKNEPMNQLIDQFLANLKNEPQTEVSVKLQQQLQAFVTTGKQQLGQQGLTELTRALFGGKTDLPAKETFKIMQSLGIIAQEQTENSVLQQVKAAITNELLTLQSSGKSVSQAIAFVKEFFQQAQIGNKDGMVAALKQFVNWMESNDAKLALNATGEKNQMINKSNNPPLQEQIASLKALTVELSNRNTLTPELINRLEVNVTKQALSTILTIAKEAGTSQELTTVTQQLLKAVEVPPSNQQAAIIKIADMMNETVMTGKPPILPQAQEAENRVFELLAKQTVNNFPTLEEGKTATEMLKHVIQSLGLQYEKDISSNILTKLVQDADRQEELKPLLIRYLNENPPHVLKDSAEQLLNRITGMQLLTQEVGPVMQFVVQMPVSLWNSTTDVTMQWSGRKTPDGKIDPSYCRVLFYLNLESLKETIVDMQIQNRVLNVNIINEHEALKHLSKPLIQGLKDKLLTLNYQLSSVNFTIPSSPEQAVSLKGSLPKIVESSRYERVDIRI